MEANQWETEMWLLCLRNIKATEVGLKSFDQNFSFCTNFTISELTQKLHEHPGRCWRKNLLWTIFEEQFPVPRYTAAGKIGNSIISLLWQLRCRCNPDHNKFPSLSNTIVVTISLNLCLWQRSLCSNLGGIDPEKLYRATLSIAFMALKRQTWDTSWKIFKMRSEQI